MRYTCTECGDVSGDVKWLDLRPDWHVVDQKVFCSGCLSAPAEICNGERTCIHCSLCIDCYARHDCPENGVHEEQPVHECYQCGLCAVSTRVIKSKGWLGLYAIGWRSWRAEMQDKDGNWMRAAQPVSTTCPGCSSKMKECFE